MTAPVGRELSCSTPAAAPLYLKKYKVVIRWMHHLDGRDQVHAFLVCRGYFERSFAFFSELLTGWRKTSRIKTSANWKTCSGRCGYTENAKLHFTLYCYPMEVVPPAKMFAPS